MMMTRQEAGKYPDCARYLMYEFTKLPDKKPKVYAAFSRYAGSFASMSSMWGFDPIIKADPYDMMNQCENDGNPEPQKDGSTIQRRSLKWYGFTVPTKGIEEIYLAPDLMERAGTAEVRAVLEATILHELIHWCRKVAGKDVNDEEPPYAFEKAAYGKTVERTWQSCKSEVYFGRRRDVPSVVVDD